VIRLVVVGAGRVFERFHLPALRTLSQWDLAGVVDSNPSRLAWAAAQVPGVVTEHSLDRLLQRLRPDAVLIASSPETHCALAVQVLRGGAHVLIEKPMVLEAAEAEELLKLSRELDRQIWVGFNRRFRPAYSGLRARLAAWPRDAVRWARFQLCSDPLGWGAISPRPQLPDPVDALLQDIGTHQLDLLPWLLRRDPTRVRAQLLQRDDRGTRAQLDLEFPGGLVASCVAGHSPGYLERLVIGGKAGTWVAGPGGLIRHRVLPEAAAGTWLETRARARALAHKLMGQPGDTLETFRRQFLAWAEALEPPAGSSAAPPEPVAADGWAGARSVALVQACRQSLALNCGWIDVTYPNMLT
jgi:predicted dehydrogenase